MTEGLGKVLETTSLAGAAISLTYAGIDYVHDQSKRMVQLIAIGVARIPRVGFIALEVWN